MKTFSSSTVTLADPVICCGREWRASRRDREKRPDPSRRIALPGGPQADWQQWDSFLTNVVKKLGADSQPALRDQLGETFLDSRYQLVQLLRAGSADPVPQLFADAWNRLAPILKQALFARWMRPALFPVSGSAWEFFALRRMRYGPQLG